MCNMHACCSRGFSAFFADYWNSGKTLFLRPRFWMPQQKTLSSHYVHTDESKKNEQDMVECIVGA